MEGDKIKPKVTPLSIIRTVTRKGQAWPVEGEQVWEDEPSQVGGWGVTDARQVGRAGMQQMGGSTRKGLG